PFTCTSSLLLSPPVCGNVTCQTRTRLASENCLSQVTPHNVMPSATSTVTPTWISLARLTPHSLEDGGTGTFVPAYTARTGPSLEPSMNWCTSASLVVRASSGVPVKCTRPSCSSAIRSPTWNALCRSCVTTTDV